MANRYTFNNELSLFISETTMDSVYKDALRSPKPTLACCQSLLDFYTSKNLTQVRKLAILFIQSTRELDESRITLEVMWFMVPTILVNMSRC